MALTKQDLCALQTSYLGRMLSYEGHYANGGLREGEIRTLKWMRQMYARLEAAIEAAPEGEEQP